MDEVEHLSRFHLHIIPIDPLDASHSSLRRASNPICRVDQRRIFLSCGKLMVSSRVTITRCTRHVARVITHGAH